MRMFEEYGYVVRVGPNDLVIFHPEAMELLDGSKATHTKEPWYDILHPMTSLVFERDKEESHF
ncbi:hypothetical protein SS1G_06520 [Sclerotinia sclerotiorum 1980 UF-70]|uniref:Uncharacterized protein n=1 Tax=Sclerotinia sclerotiorum (strain ATCC 18683 / 1980 / Ss-1) TaxID=665079 RepID=A7EMH2_SCLS1|nr:hypothetical protein SS1G_06520 [Sclerotinia sclerotiorum 1980 UF-70]EDO04038.1 hypothetical protein SS1G_06520 [Sclerotinia sclerotiorum 1980 UF-70]